VTNPFESETGEYLVLVNDEGQYSLWPTRLEIPAGWKPTGQTGDRAECLAWVERNWTDPRPATPVRQDATHEPGER
jgi:MbtH protein